MSSTGRTTARIRILDTGETLDLEYQHPLIDISGSSRTKRHEPIGESAVVQHLGSEARELEMRGHCYSDEAEVIDNLSEYGRVEVRTERWSGFAIVEDHRTQHTKAKGGKRPESTHENKNFDYRLTLTEIDAPAPDET